MSFVTYSQLGKMGQLGNQCFELASSIGIAIKNDVLYAFPDWSYQQYFVNHLPNPKDFIEEHKVPFKIIQEKAFTYEDVKLDKYYNYDIRGYLQSYKYWEPYATEIVKKYFEFDKKIADKVRKTWYNTLSSGNTVTVHIRLGDYLKFSDYHTNLQETFYYLDATNLVKAQLNGQINLIVCSDDIKWCQNNFEKLLDNNISRFRILYSTGQNEVEDLILQTLVSHNIIANSTFSYWGALLNKNESKLVISPGNFYSWFGKASNHSITDLIPKDWCKL